MEEDWEMVDYNTPSVDSSSKMKMGMGMRRWVVNVGKKVIITGLLLPFLPCLLVILALGLACSVPYGVVFISYACTQKLMNKLLPPPPPHELEPHKETRIDHQVEEQPHKEIRIDHQLIMDNDAVEIEIEVEDAAGVRVNQQKEKEEVEKQQQQLPHFDVDKTKELEKHKNSEQAAEKIITEVDKIDDKKQQQQRSKESAGGKRRKAKGKKMESKGGGVVVSSTLKVEEEDDSGVRVKYTESTVIAAAAGGELKQEKKQVAGALKSPDQEEEEESYSDEKIWEKIDGMREIAGFNAPKRDSYFEELKALYLFTGIEAPETSPADTPAEFYTKLAFLMSVIGLK